MLGLENLPLRAREGNEAWRPFARDHGEMDRNGMCLKGKHDWYDSSRLFGCM